MTYVEVLVDVEIGIHVALVVTVDSSVHARPCLLEGQDSLNVVSVELLAGHGVDDGGLDTKEWKRSASRLGRSDTCKRGDDVGAGLGLPVGLSGVSHVQSVTVLFTLLTSTM